MSSDFRGCGAVSNSATDLLHSDVYSAGTDKDQGDTVDLLTEKTLPFAKILPAAFIRFSTSALPNDITDLSPNEYIIVNYEGEPFPESGLPVIKEEEEMDVDGKEEEKGGVDAGV